MNNPMAVNPLVGSVSGGALPMSQSFLAFPVSMPAFGEEAFETNSIMSEPCDFIGEDLPNCAIVRPTLRQNASLLAVGHFLTKETDHF